MSMRMIITAVLAAIVCTQPCSAESVSTLQLERMGAIFVGGRIVDVPYPAAGTPVTGESQWIEQALVLYFIPRHGHHTPLVLVPGLNLSGYIYLGTPDGRAGWAQIFAAHGFDVYVFNDPLLSISGGFAVSPFNAAKTGDAPAADQSELGLWTMEPVWSRWGFGPEYGTPYPDVRYPVDHVDQFYAAIPINHDNPVGSGKFGSIFKGETLAKLMVEIGEPAILMVHSAGSNSAIKAAQSRPDLVKGFILVEPVGTPSSSDFPAFSGKVCLGVYGDYITERGQDGRKASTAAAVELFNVNGGVGGMIDLPEDHGIHGNTHIMMQDNNNDVIAQMIIDWLEAAGVAGSDACPQADLNGDCKVNLYDLQQLAEDWLIDNSQS